MLWEGEVSKGNKKQNALLLWVFGNGLRTEGALGVPASWSPRDVIPARPRSCLVNHRIIW